MKIKIHDARESERMTGIIVESFPGVRLFEFEQPEGCSPVLEEDLLARWESEDAEDVRSLKETCELALAWLAPDPA